jgi:hypothetical protein
VTKVIFPVLFAVNVPDLATADQATGHFIQFMETFEEVIGVSGVTHIGDPLAVSEEQVDSPDFWTEVRHGQDVLPKYERRP